jgi:hypothetical protein
LLITLEQRILGYGRAARLTVDANLGFARRSLKHAPRGFKSLRKRRLVAKLPIWLVSSAL